MKKTTFLQKNYIELKQTKRNFEHLRKKKLYEKQQKHLSGYLMDG